jgi:hypothetical protein
MAMTIFASSWRSCGIASFGTTCTLTVIATTDAAIMPTTTFDTRAPQIVMLGHLFF